MPSEKRKATGTESRGILNPGKRDDFKRDAVAGMSDTELARVYAIPERTATNWRIRLVGHRPKRNAPAPCDPSAGLVDTPNDRVNDTTEGAA